MKEHIVQKTFLILGCLSLLLGFIGIFLPVLPTTPFILLAAFFFERGSPKFHRYLVEHKTFGPMIDDWQKHKRIKRKAKVFALTFMALGYYFPASNPNISLNVKVAIALTMACVAIYIVTRNESESP